MPRIVATCGRKGGVGKSTIASGLAALWLRSGRSVLLVDLDPQCNSSWGVGADPNGSSTADLLLQRSEPQTLDTGLMVYAGGTKLDDREIERLHPEQLGMLLDQAKCDVVICDCPPGNLELERLGVTAADTALVIANAHPYATMGLLQLANELDDAQKQPWRSPQRWALVASRIDGRRRDDRKLTSSMEDEMPSVPRFQVREDIELARATGERRLLDGVGRGIEDLEAIRRWIDEEK